MPSLIQRLKSFNSNRDQDLLRLKYKAMSQGVFRFFRGSCHLFYEDFVKLVSWKDVTHTWICGDLHIENFGTYKGDNGLVYFDMNDFDEAVMAPATREIARTVTSIHLAAKDISLTDEMGHQLAENFLDTYISVLQKGKPVAVERPAAKGILKDLLVQVSKRTHKDVLKDRTIFKKGKVQIKVDGIRALLLGNDEKEVLKSFFNDWSRQCHLGKWSFKDAAIRVAGTGSIGISRFVILAEKKKEKRFDFFDMKQARPSCLLPYIKTKQLKWENESERVVAIQQMMQHVSPALLEPVCFQKKHFIIKQLQPMADKMDLALCNGRLRKLEIILQTMAESAASGQLRSSGRRGSSTADELIQLALHQAQWKKELLSFAARYSKQVQKDYAIFVKAFKEGKLK